ncbi:LacI family transcriptional regulator [Catalinimonas alkaloidigena]|uniref:LacI family DNA-binding transcriptional regulator n=1 Tax=Catalinimonas alkaloidigena TaxID=1075417 RepID=UPI002406B8CE|nr:LacI family DNA-binding transcriptional regulator [Catalinimonas alkaloidigena]MDF9798923.1 LacI family transcriptional regulator [Catalinimonas alkaloidigena]
MSKNNGGHHRSGVKEIARRAKVSLATVDRVIHNRTGVSDSTRKKIQKIIDEIDYQPNLLASRLASRKVYDLAILIPKVSKETNYWQAPLDGIERAASEISKYGIRVSRYLFELNSKASFIKKANQILDASTDGILLAPSFIEETVEFLNKCKARNIPYVFIDSDIPEQESLCYIGPDLKQSGYLAAHLMNYGLSEMAKLLVVNISKEIDNHHHLLRKEEGFRNYFKDNLLSNPIIKVDILQTNYTAIRDSLKTVFKEHPDIKAVFTTNSRVSSVARFLESVNKNDLLLVGYDYLKDNIECLKSKTVDFLICQKPEEQGFKGVMALYKQVVLSGKVDKVHYMPIDIITRENYAYYSN